MKTIFLFLVFSSGILFAVPSTLEGYDLSCWHCNSQMDAKCSEETFNREVSNTIMKAPCSKMQKELNIRKPATTCLKAVFKPKEGLPIIERRCAYIGNPMFANVHEPKCYTDSGNGNTITHCFCKGSYCNGSTMLSSWSPLLSIIPILLVCKNLLEQFLPGINLQKK